LKTPHAAWGSENRDNEEKMKGCDEKADLNSVALGAEEVPGQRVQPDPRKTSTWLNPHIRKGEERYDMLSIFSE